MLVGRGEDWGGTANAYGVSFGVIKLKLILMMVHNSVNNIVPLNCYTENG